jgi:hypothetical protein
MPCSLYRIWLKHTCIQPTDRFAADDKTGVHRFRICSHWINTTFLNLNRSCEGKYKLSLLEEHNKCSCIFTTCSYLFVVIYRKFCRPKFHSNARPLRPFKHCFAADPVRFISHSTCHNSRLVFGAGKSLISCNEDSSYLYLVSKTEHYTYAHEIKKLIQYLYTSPNLTEMHKTIDH